MNTMTQPRRILTPTEETAHKERIGEEMNERRETETHYPVGGRVGITPQALKMQENLKASENEKNLSENQKRDFEKEAKTHKEWLKANMLPRKYLGAKISKDGVMDMQTQKHVNHMAKVEMGSEFVERAQRYKYLVRALGRPKEANLENFRSA